MARPRLPGSQRGKSPATVAVPRKPEDDYAPFSLASATARQWASKSAAPKSSASLDASRISENAVGGRAVKRPVSEFCLESKLRVEFLRQILHPNIFRQADDLDRLDAMVGGGAQDALEQLLADAAAPIILVDRKSRLGMDVASERRLLAPDRLVGAQFGRADQLAVDERPVE